MTSSPSPTTYERLADLPVVIDGYALDGLSRRVSTGFRRFTTVFRLAGGGHEGVGEDVTYEAAEHRRVQRAGPVLALAGSWTLDGFSRHLDRARHLPGRAAHARRLARVPALGAGERGAGPGAAPGRPGAARRARTQTGARALRRLAEPGTGTDLRAAAEPTGSLPGVALQARRHRAVGRRAAGMPGRQRHHRRDRLQGRLPGHAVRHAHRPRPVPPRRRGAARRLAGRPRPGRPGRPRRPARAPPPRDVGRPDPQRRRHRRASHGRRAPSTSSRRGSGRCVRCWTPTTTAPPMASAPTAAVNTNSVPDAARSNTWPRSFTPTRPTTSRPPASTSPLHHPTRRALR